MIGEPQNVRSARTRTAILDAAWRLLEEEGPEGANMGRVAERAGVTRRGLYLHFASRAQLLLAVRQHIDSTAGLAESIGPIFAAPDAHSALREWVRHLTEYHVRLRMVLDALDRARSTDSDVAVLWEEAMEGWRTGCRHLADRLARDGVLAPGWTVEEASDALWALMLGFNRMWGALVVERRWTRERVAEFFLRLHVETFTG